MFDADLVAKRADFPERNHFEAPAVRDGAHEMLVDLHQVPAMGAHPEAVRVRERRHVEPRRDAPDAAYIDLHEVDGLLRRSFGGLSNECCHGLGLREKNRMTARDLDDGRTRAL